MLSITGMGLVTSVGRDARTTCASIRAGLARPTALSYPLPSELDGDPPIGHQVAGYTDGFYLVGRWTRLALGALADLAGSDAWHAEADPVAFWEQTGLVLAMPDVRARYAGSMTVDAEDLGQALLKRLFDLAGFGPVPAHVWLCPYGHAGAFVGLHHARALVRAQVLRRVLVLGVDSYLDAPSLAWMAARGALRVGDGGEGVQPGEAAACVLLERGTVAPTAVSDFMADHTDVVSDDTVQTGRQIGVQIGAWLDAAGVPLPHAGDIIVDLTGAPWRAKEIGTALSALGPRHIAPDAAMLLPCGSTGDVGSASAVLALAVASRALTRGYARSPVTLILARSPGGAYGAAVVTRVNASGRR